MKFTVAVPSKISRKHIQNFLSNSGKRNTTNANLDRLQKPGFVEVISGCIWLLNSKLRPIRQFIRAQQMGECRHNRHGPKRGGAAAVCPFRGELGPRLIQCGLGGARSTSVPSGIFIHLAWGSWVPIEHKVARAEAYLCTNGHWPKIWGTVPLQGRGAGSSPNTMSRRLRPTSVPSGILMHPAVWPQ